MAFKIIPTSVAGVQLPFNQLKGPLAKLWNKETKPNLYYPQDIGNNPAQCHVVQITIYEYTTDFEQNVGKLKTLLDDPNLSEKAKEYIKQGKGALTEDNLKELGVSTDKAKSIAAAGLDIVKNTYAAKTYKTRAGGDALANISLYMPDSLSVDYNASYTDVSLTQAVGKGGMLASAISELGGGKGVLSGEAYKNLLNSAAGKELAKGVAGGAAKLLGMGDMTSVVGQAMKQIANPQLQLIYQGVGFREFQLDFIFTPKSSAEAESTKKIIDTLVYYSSPAVAGQNTTDQQQYLVPPQLFDVKFLFTGKNGIAGALGSAFNKALSKVGLDFLSNKQQQLSIDASANQNKNLFYIGECVLTDVSVDYAPNGWAAFDDGHPIQTKLSLRFKETNIVTKQRLDNEGKSPVKGKK